jgi:multidrug resistance efflux pump
MKKEERIYAEWLALTAALQSLLAQLDHASEDACRSTLRAAREGLVGALLYAQLSDEQSAHAQAVLVLIEQDLSQALPLSFV